MRGYLLAGKEEFLEPYNSGLSRFDSLVASLKQTVSDNPAQVELLDEMSATIQEWIDQVTEPTIALRREIGDAKTMDDMADIVGEARGKVYFDKFRGLMADFIGEEEVLMLQRKASNDTTVSFTYTTIILTVLASLVLGALLAWIVGKVIANPIIDITDSMRSLSEGDTSVDIHGQDRKDEIGAMANAVEVFKQNKITADTLSAQQREEEERKEQEHKRVSNLITGFEATMTTVLSNLSEADESMRNVQSEVQSSAEATKSESATVASAITQANQNVETVASAAEELSSSISEIGRQVSDATVVSNEAVSTAHDTTAQIQVLEENVSKISEIVGLINDIADQTNLLALNATIEAARAGDAGKGFAVVASEVKSLANQTAVATEEISNQISKVQNSTSSAVDSIGTVTTVIEKISEISSSIASAVEEQGVATSEIARNVEEAAEGTQSVSRSISDVLRLAERSDAAANDMSKTSESLSGETRALQDRVKTFLQEVQSQT